MPQNQVFQAAAATPTGKLTNVQANGQGALLTTSALYPGNTWYVNETTGSDTNAGTYLKPFATLDAAQSAAVANNGDVVYLMGTSHRSTTLNWAKNGVSLVSMLAPSGNGRGRISVAAGLTQTQVTALHPLVNVTAQGCNFVGLGTFYGFDGVLTPPTASICWYENGGRNYYDGVEFMGGGDTLMAALAGMRSLVINGTGECRFNNCTLGLDTITRATNANATLELTGGTPRNVMMNPVFRALVSDTADVHITVGASGMDRDFMLFNPIFLNAVYSTGSTMAAAITINASAGGAIVLANPMSVGATALATTGNVYVTGPVPTATTSGIGILAT